MRSILVTGGAGFIGSNFIFRILKRYDDARVVCLDSLTYAGNLSTLKSVQNDRRFLFVRASISDRNTVDALFEKEKFDEVVNFAAESHVDRSIVNPGIFIDTNVVGTEVLLEASLKYGVKRFHQVSTDEVYGDLPLDRPDLLFTEESPIRPSSPYSASKASADLLALAYFRTFSLPVTVSRCSNNYGPYQFPEKLIPLMIINAVSGKKLPIYGKGLNVRDWIYVEDHCGAIDSILTNGKPGEVYNVGSRNEKSNIEIVGKIISITGASEEQIEFVPDRKGHDLRYAIDPSKTEKLPWKPETDFEKGISLTVDWYLNNKMWWEEIISGEYRDYYEKMYGGES